MALWRPQVEQGLANGPGYGLTELEGLNAAIAKGAEGRDAAALWGDEIKRHFRTQRRPMLDGLRAELSVIGPERVEQIIQAYAPRAAGDPAQARAAEQARVQHSTWNTFTYRWVRSEATCASLSSTPEASRRLYPDRAPFTFERFGIDEPRLAQWCEVIVCEGVELLPQVRGRSILAGSLWASGASGPTRPISGPGARSGIAGTAEAGHSAACAVNRSSSESRT